MRQTPMHRHTPHRPLIADIPSAVPWILFMSLVAAAVPLASVSTPPSAAHTVAHVESRIAARGFDSHHRALPFVIYVLTEQSSWKLESTADLEGDRPLLSNELADAVNRAREVFCIGTASFEGVQHSEETRAARRASRMAEWVSSVVRHPRNTRVFTLNAGQYMGPKEISSSRQRRAIIIAASQHDDNINLGEALASGLALQQSSHPVVYSLVHNYSRSADWLKSIGF